MHKKRLKAYQSLINALLNCNEGDEWELLQANQELVDAHLIHEIQKVVEKLTKNGDERRANFLQNLADTLMTSSAYWAIIDQLLNCASDEEVWQILDANRDWVDTGLQQTMLKVAEDLRTQGYLDKSNFLMNLGEQLMTVHGSISELHHDFLMQVLQATAESNGNVQVVYSLLAANTDKLDESFAELLRARATTTLAKATTDTAEGIAAHLFLFSNLIQQFPLGNKASNMEIAIAGYEIVLTVYTRNACSYKWAATQTSLGTAYLYRIRGNKAENLELAISYYQEALKVYTVDTSPMNGQERNIISVVLTVTELMGIELRI